MIVQIYEQFFVADDLRPPGGTVEVLHLSEELRGKVEAIPADILITGCPADRRLAPGRAAVHTIDNPFQYPHVLAEAGPEELAAAILAKPIHVENAGRHAK